MQTRRFIFISEQTLKFEDRRPHVSPATQNDENLTESCMFDMFFLCCPSLPTRYNLACHRLETLLQNIDLPPLNSANNAQYFLRKPDKVVEEDQRVFSAYQDCIQLQLQLNLAHHAVQRLRVSLGANRKSLPTGSAPECQELVHNSSTEQLRTIIRYLLDTLLSLLHSNNGKNSAEGKSQDTGGFKMQELNFPQRHSCDKDLIFLCAPRRPHRALSAAEYIPRSGLRGAVQTPVHQWDAKDPSACWSAVGAAVWRRALVGTVPLQRAAGALQF